MSCLVVPLFACIHCFFPLFSPVDPETEAGPVIDYVDDDPSSLSAELTSKSPL